MTRNPSVDVRSAASPEVVSRRLVDGAVVVHLSTNRVFELNETGARIWELLAELQDVEAVTDAMQQEFDVDDRQARLQVADTVERLRAEGLLK